MSDSSLDGEEVIVLRDIDDVSGDIDAESIKAIPVRQSRLLSWMFSKRVPPVPTEEERVNYQETPRHFFSYLFFWWLIPLYKVGYKRTIEETDIAKFPSEMHVAYHHALFEKDMAERIENWQRKHPGKKNWPVTLLLMSVVNLFRMRWLMSAVASIIWAAAITGNPMVTKALVNFVEERIYNRSSMSVGPAIGCAFATGVLSLVNGLAFAHTLNFGLKAGIDTKAVLVKAVFDKSMKLDAAARVVYPSSKISSMIGNDLSRIEFSFSFIPLAFGFAAGLIASIALLIYNIGVSALAGIGLLAITCGAQGYLSTKLYKFRSKANKYTDARAAFVKEVVYNFKMIKLYNWEEPYMEKIREARTAEAKIFLSIKMLRAAVETATDSITPLATMVSFLIYYKLRGISDVASIFSSLTLFGVLAVQIAFVPLILSSGVDALSSLNRVVGLIQCGEEEVTVPLAPSASDIALEVSNGCFKWEEVDTESTDKVEKAYRLQTRVSASSNSIVPIESIVQHNFNGFHNIDITIKRGQFVIISGLIGSGKTSLLNALRGHMKQTSGKLASSGSISFCGVPWLQNATIRENIVFGSDYDTERYNNVLYACALVDDINLLPAGDLTELGERGVNLSGGQKARINLARAVYANRDTILLDDVLSAVDAKVGHHIIQHCLQGLLKDKTRVLATHQLSLINKADSVIFLNGDGTISQGDFASLKASNAEFARLLSFSSTFADNLQNEDADKEDGKVNTVAKKSQRSAAKDGKIIVKEEKAVNQLSWGVYKAFWTSGSGIFRYVMLAMCVISLIFNCFCTQFVNVWLSFWSEEKFDSLSPDAYMAIYIMFNIVSVLCSFVNLASLGWAVNNASKSMVLDAIGRVLHAPISFIDTTPLGRVLNRFTKDTDVLDNELFASLESFLVPVVAAVGSLILCVVYLPWIAFSVPAFFLISLLTASYSQSTTRETKRIEAVNRSAIFDNINECLGGLDTIKAYNAEARFMERNNFNIDRNNETQYVTFSTQRWLQFFLSVPSALFSLLVAILAVCDVFHLSAASTGLLLSSVILLSDNVSIAFRTALNVENNMNSAERLHQYSTKLIQEAPYEVSEFTPSPNWPQNPSLEFRNVEMAYRPGLPSVLNNISFEVKARQKIGICGRTGAGKSSIMNALYRLNELKHGQIIIDGLDISRMGLASLRSKLSIIPQETVLFKGTIRYNLDPFGTKSDVVLWDALRKSGLVKEGENSKFELDAIVEEDGTNFSLGEKQLIALARVLSRDSNILILDEATSSVDYETDSKIQATIKNEFDYCTILCIAHRLNTILDYDKILVLDAGEVREYDTPYNLFMKEDSIFREMCANSNITLYDIPGK